MFRLEALGGLVVLNEARTEVATQHRRLALLALLSASDVRGLSRAKLQAYLWSESTADSARHGLEQLLYYLRRQLAPDAFLGQDSLRLNPQVITSDVADFRKLLARQAFADAAQIYRGAFLDGFFLNGAPEFERWVEEERERLATAYRVALSEVAEERETHGSVSEAAEWWRKLLIADPLSTRATLGLMRTIAAGGDRAGALRVAREHSDLVQRELGGPPSPEVGELMADICRTPAARLVLPPSHMLPADTPKSVVQESAPATPSGKAARASRHLLALGMAAGTLATAGAIAVLASRPRVAPPLDPNLVAVAPFEVLDPGLELWREGLVDILSANFDGAGPLRAVPPTVVVRRWRGRVDHASTGDLARRNGARWGVFGRLGAMDGDSVRLRAALLDASSDRIVGELEISGTEAGLDRLSDSLTIGLLRELGRTRRVGAVRSSSLGARSLPALKDYLRGEQFYRRWAAESALVYYQRAVELDSSFAMAMSRTSQLLWPREDSLARVFAERAGALNRGLGPRDSFLLTADSLFATTGFGSQPFDIAASYRRRRVLATLEAAAARYPDDPEVWYQLGDARYHLGWDSPDSLEQALQALDRAIALDSGFGLPYGHAVTIAGQLGDWDGARRRASAVLQQSQPSGETGEVGTILTEGTKLIVQVMGPAGIATRDTESSLTTAQPMALWYAWEVFQGMVDSTEIAVQIARIIFSRQTDERSSQLRLQGFLLRNSHRLLASSLGFRGHVREAAGILEPTDSALLASLFAELALQGGVPHDTARAVFDRWLHRDPFWPAGGLVFALPWWSANGDTASLEAFRLRATAASAEVHLSASAQPNLDDPRYAAAAAHAYLALARRDTNEALRRLSALPAESCPWCFLERLTSARLLAARGMVQDALAILARRFPLVYALPSRPVWELDRARLAERAGDEDTARKGYHFITEVWRNADPPLQAYVAEAREALQRLSRSPDQ